MHNKFEAPEVTLIGQAGEVVMGGGPVGNDVPFFSASDFEFEQDSL